jgi:hypothetical protein
MISAVPYGGLRSNVPTPPIGAYAPPGGNMRSRMGRRRINGPNRTSRGVFSDGEPAGFQSSTGTLGSWTTESPDEYDWSGDQDGFFPATRLRQQYTDYLSTKVEEYEEQKISRHYYHGAQWTPEEIRALRARRQPIITFNRVSRKVDNIAMLVQRLRQDPKCFPGNQRSVQGADLATSCLRSALAGLCEGGFEYLDFEITKQAAMEGIGVLELKLVEGDHGDPDVGGDFVFGDDFFYDPRSYKPDFSDARYMGVAKWLDLEAAIELFPDQEDKLRSLLVETGFDLTTHSDREYKWVYVNEQRIRLVEHWYKHRGKWYWAFYCSFIMLEQGRSPFQDERGQDMCRFVPFSCAVDHDGDRYGFVRNLKGPQDEYNHRRSKALHISNTSRLVLEKGSVEDTETTRREYARPDGLVEYNRGFQKPEPADKQEDLKAQAELMQGAVLEIDSFAQINPSVFSPDTPDMHSGVAINLLQKAGTADLGSFIKHYRNWKLRAYKAVWSILTQYWVSERYIRVGDDDTPQFIQVNGVRPDQWGRPQFINKIGSLSVEIMLDEGPDTVSLMTEAYEMVKDDPSVPWPVKLELMPMAPAQKKKLQSLIQQSDKPDPKVQAAQMQAQARTQQIQAKGQIDFARAQQQMKNDQVLAQAEQQGNVLDFHTQQVKSQAEVEKANLDRQAAREKTLYQISLLREQRTTLEHKHRLERETMSIKHAQQRKAARQPKRASA